MAETLVAGVDCSTQATKVVLVDADSGSVVASGRHPHRVTGTDGARETPPVQWWEALGSALQQTGRATEVAAIAVAGQQHGLVVLDERGEPLRPAVLWNDTRSAPQAAGLREDLGGAQEWAERVGLVPVASFTVAKWAWLRDTEPWVVERTRAIRLPHDFITERLAGAGVTDRGDASGTGWWSARTEDYADEVLELDRTRLDRALLPTVLSPTDVAGHLSRSRASELGLPAGAVVAPGTGDNMAAALGLGLEPGTPVISLGTSGTAYAVAEQRPVDPSGIVAGFADATGRFLPLAATLNCTLAVDRLASLLNLDREDVAANTDCVVLPYLDGERTPDLPHALGSIVGLRHQTSRQEILWAAYEGAAASLLEALASIDRTGAGLRDDCPLVLIGGGARGTAWRSVVGALSGRALEVPAEAELVALGAAVQAAAVLLREPLVDVAARWRTRRGETVPPRPADEARMAEIRRVRSLLDDLNRQRMGTRPLAQNSMRATHG